MKRVPQPRESVRKAKVSLQYCTADFETYLETWEFSWSHKNKFDGTEEVTIKGNSSKPLDEIIKKFKLDRSLYQGSRRGEEITIIISLDKAIGIYGGLGNGFVLPHIGQCEDEYENDDESPKKRRKTEPDGNGDSQIYKVDVLLKRPKLETTPNESESAPTIESLVNIVKEESSVPGESDPSIIPTMDVGYDLPSHIKPSEPKPTKRVGKRN